MSLRNQLILSSAATALMLGGLACGYPDPAQDEYLAACGDGIVEGGEQCDDGNLANDDACTSSCKLAFCGDGFVHGGVEVCDDGNVRDGDACNASCSAGSGCGNGVVDPGEACDDGNQNNSDACVGNCVAARCGDGFAQLGVEQCDDGNDVDADGCNNTCTLSQQEIGSCPGLELPVSVANSTSVVGTTQTAEDSAVGSCVLTDDR